MVSFEPKGLFFSKEKGLLYASKGGGVHPSKSHVSWVKYGANLARVKPAGIFFFSCLTPFIRDRPQEKKISPLHKIINMNLKNSIQNQAEPLNLIEKDMAYLLGALRDGCFIKNEKYYTYRIRIYQKNKQWIETLSTIMHKLFKKKPTITLDNRDNVWNLMVNSREIYEKLTRISDFTGNQKTWNVPKIILNSPLEIQKEFLKGFFDSEGGLPHMENGNIEPKNIRIHFTQSNRKCLEEVKEIVQKLGIKTGKVCGPYYKKGFEEPVYRLKIHGRREVAKFSKIVGSLHNEKQKRLNFVVKTLVEA